MKTSRLWIGLALLSLGVTSCKEDYFDQNEYDELVKKNFPVKNIDSSHTWATTGTATANISFGGDYGKEYKVGVYLENPMDAESVTSLYSGTIKGGSSISVPVTYPLYVNSVYVAVFDDKGHRVVQRTNIENGALNVVVGTAASSTRAVESDYTETYAKSLEDYLNPDVEMIRTALRQNNEVAWKADQVTVGDNVTLAAMQAYTPFSNADLYDNHRTLSDMYYAGEVGTFIGNGDGKHYRVAAGTVVTEVFHINGAANVVNDAVIYVEGTLHLNGNTLNGPTIVVGNGGQVIIDGNTSMSNCGRFVVYPTGSIVSAENVSGVEFNVTNGAACYNSGVIDIDGTLNLNGSDFYNNNSVEVDVFTGTAGGSKCTNFGHITARTNSIAGSAYNQNLINGCYLHFTEDAGIGEFVLLDNSRIDCDGQLLITGQTTSYGNTVNNILYDKSMINANSIYWNNGSAQGPTTSGEFAVVKAQKFLVSHANDLKTYNNVYFDVPREEFYDYQNNQIDINNPWTSAYHIQGGVTPDGQSWCDAPISLWSTEASAIISIPAGDCTGVGYNDTDEEIEVPTPTENPQSYRFCFEDNFPEIGDYDFNDAVVTVTPKISGNVVDLKVTIDAVGATEQLGVAFRIKGVTPGALVLDECTQDGYFDADIPTTSYNIIPGAEGIMDESYLANGIYDVVVKMTSNVHWAVGRTLTTGGMVENYFYNTVERTNDFTAKRNDVEKPTVTYHFVCGSEEVANQFTQANIDVFIVEGFNGGYWEVHTVPYKTDEVLRDYAAGNKMQYNNNFPWAICVPGDFRYPIEWQSIGFKEDGVITGAYQEPGHSFGEWAEDHTQATDWYLYPTSGLVY